MISNLFIGEKEKEKKVQARVMFQTFEASSTSNCSSWGKLAITADETPGLPWGGLNLSYMMIQGQKAESRLGNYLHDHHDHHYHHPSHLGRTRDGNAPQSTSTLSSDGQDLACCQVDDRGNTQGGEDHGDCSTGKNIAITDELAALKIPFGCYNEE